jgi:hypothetical protein
LASSVTKKKKFRNLDLRLFSAVLFLLSLTLPLTTTSTANVDGGASTNVDAKTSHGVENKTSVEPVNYQHCTIDGLFCLPSNYSK